MLPKSKSILNKRIKYDYQTYSHGRTHTIEFADLPVLVSELDDTSEIFWKTINLAQYLTVEHIPTVMLMTRIISRLYTSIHRDTNLLSFNNIKTFQQDVNNSMLEFSRSSDLSLVELTTILNNIYHIVKTGTGQRGIVASSKINGLNRQIKLSNMFDQFYVKKMVYPQYRATRYIRELTLKAPCIPLEMTLQFGTSNKELKTNDHENAILLIKTIQRGYTNANV